MTWSVNNRGHNNPAFKGAAAGYGAIHAWVRRRFPKPTLCQHCNNAPPRDLANKSGEYTRDLFDWEYLCRRCHMNGDGRNYALVESGRSRKLSNVRCTHCHIVFHPEYKGRQYCSRSCYFAHRKGKVQ